MKPDPEKPVRHGITPVGLICLGLFVMLAVAFGMISILGFFRWLIEWLAGGK